MLKKLGLPLFLFLFFLVTIPSFYFISSQSITITEKKVVYELPYPGILPDHPLFSLKKIRDQLSEMATRDTVKKAEFYLHQGDKKISAARLLAKKGKNVLAGQALVDAETYAAKVTPLALEARRQGAGPTEQFVEKIRLSNAKHRQVIQELLKEIPQGDQVPIEKALLMNDQVKKSLLDL